MTGRVVVTGGSGGAGRHVVRDLLDAGYDVVTVDLVDDGQAPFVELDLRDGAAVLEVLAGADAVVHLAANPAPDTDPVSGTERFEHNTVTTFNVFWAAGVHGVPRVVWASSETVLGYPFTTPPRYLPVDEDHVAPSNGYALSKVACEELARWMHALHGTTFVGLRYSNVMHTDPEQAASYARLPDAWADPHARKENLWGYIDARDAGRAARLALEADLTGAHVMIIAAADTATSRPNAELVAEVFPGTPLDPALGPNAGLLSIERARSLIGFEPQWSWRQVLNSPDPPPP